MQQALQYVEANRERFIAELCEYVRFPSVSAQSKHAGDLRACAEWLAAHCDALGLNARIHRTEGHPVVTARTPHRRGAKRPHYLVYGHYDVQPAEPFELWNSAPFEPRRDGSSLYARGVSDNKGQHLAHLKAVEAYLKTGEELPCDLTFLIEGEEEVGSANLTTFLKQQRARLQCDGIVVSDTGMPRKDLPALTYALRGVVGLEIRVRGPARDLHSGIFGGSVENPAMALCHILAGLRDREGRITVPGLYDAVQPLSASERAQLARLPFNAGAYRRFLGVPQLFGERGFTAWEQRTSRPTLEINGLTSGYQGEGSKTIVPAQASAKLTLRLVPRQKPAAVIAALRRRIRELCPPTVRLELETGHSAEPYFVSPSSPQAVAALEALEAAFQCKPVLMREGGSIPIVNEFKRILGADTLLLGLGLPDDNPHSPNEKFDLDNFQNGIRLGVQLWPRLAQAGSRPR